MSILSIGGCNMKSKKFLLEKLIGLPKMTIRTALADEGQQTEPTTPVATPEPTQTQQQTINYEQLISQARQEEKAKLYPEITKLKAEKEAQLKRINELIIQVAEKDELIKQKDSEVKNATSKKVDSEEVKALKLKVEELTTSLALKVSELDEIKLTTYKESKIREVGSELVPELVRGTTAEEIDSSIVVAQQAYQAIMAKVQTATPPQAQSQVMPQVNPTMPVVNPTVNPVQTTGMDISSLSGTSLFDSNGREQYNQLRKQLGL